MAPTVGRRADYDCRSYPARVSGKDQCRHCTLSVLMVAAYHPQQSYEKTKAMLTPPKRYRVYLETYALYSRNEYHLQNSLVFSLRCFGDYPLLTSWAYVTPHPRRGKRRRRSNWRLT